MLYLFDLFVYLCVCGFDRWVAALLCLSLVQAQYYQPAYQQQYYQHQQQYEKYDAPQARYYRSVDSDGPSTSTQLPLPVVSTTTQSVNTFYFL